jgi:hypothetical protein
VIAAHERELAGLNAAHARALAARDKLVSMWRERVEKNETGQEAEQTARQAAEAGPGIAQALRQGRAMLAGWMGGKNSLAAIYSSWLLALGSWLLPIAFTTCAPAAQRRVWRSIKPLVERARHGAKPEMTPPHVPPAAGF